MSEVMDSAEARVELAVRLLGGQHPWSLDRLAAYDSKVARFAALKRKEVPI